LHFFHIGEGFHLVEAAAPNNANFCLSHLAFTFPGLTQIIVAGIWRLSTGGRIFGNFQMFQILGNCPYITPRQKYEKFQIFSPFYLDKKSDLSYFYIMGNRGDIYSLFSAGHLDNMTPTGWH
jgi:hypothetical protein